MAVEIQRKKELTSPQWETWQQFADDCQVYYNAVDNGPLPTPTSTNCLKIDQEYAPCSMKAFTFIPLHVVVYYILLVVHKD